VSFAVVMRAMGVPARVVTGYQGAERVLREGYYIVRQSHAHAWAEIWQTGRGWIRVDPTAAVAPDRVSLGRNLEPPPGLVTSTLRSVSPELLAELRAAWETVNNRWNQWVLNYSRTQQFDLLQRIGVGSPDWQALGMTLLGLLIAGALAGAAWALWDRNRQDPWLRQQAQVRAVLASLGVPAQPCDPPRRLAERLRAQLGERGDALAYQLDILDLARYGPHARRRPDRAWWRRFAFEAMRLRPGSTIGRLQALATPPR